MRDIDRACRAVFEGADCADLYVHGTGHGVGLDIHEEPFLGASGDLELVAGDVVTVEPGLYRVGTGGIRIEDLVVVTPNLKPDYPSEGLSMPAITTNDLKNWNHT